MFGSSDHFNQQGSNQTSCYFGHQLSIPIDINPLNKNGEMERKDQIQLFLQVCVSNDKGMKTVLGYGSATIPQECGDYNLNIQTCKLIASPLQNYWNNLRYIMSDYYFGCTMGHFKMMKEFFNLTSKNTVSVLSRSDQLVSHSSGTVQIHARVMSKRAKCNNDNNRNDRVRHMLDEVLSKVRRQKRSLNQQPAKRSLSIVADESLDQDTKALLSRVKARKEARLHQR